MAYSLKFRKQALEDLASLATNEKKAFAKAQILITELTEHPRTGTGKPEPLSGDRVGQWSRRINKKHRLIYEIHDNEVVVVVISAYGHYDDK